MKVLSIMLFCLASYVYSAEKNAVMLEKFDDPLAGMVGVMGAENVAKSRSTMGAEGKIVDYKHCIHNISGHKESFKMMAKEMAEESAENGQYNDTKSVTLIETCPLPANGGCDHGNRVEYFYTDSSTLLKDQKEGCEYFKKKWITF